MEERATGNGKRLRMGSGCLLTPSLYSSWSTCTDASWRVLIGHPSTTGYYKLTISANETDCINCGVAGGTNVEVKSDAAGNVNGSHISVASTPAGATHQITGLKVTTQNAALYNYGLDVSATNNVANNGFTYGAWIKAENQVGGTTAQLYGLRCNATAIAGTVVSNARCVGKRGQRSFELWGLWRCLRWFTRTIASMVSTLAPAPMIGRGILMDVHFLPGVWTSSDELCNN